MDGLFEDLFAPGDLQMQVRRAQLEDLPESFLLEVKGRLPDGFPPAASFVASVFDEGGGTRRPVLTLVDFLQENATSAYYSQSPLFELGTEIPEWKIVGVVATDPLITPFEGHRTLALVLRLVSLGESVEIVDGKVKGDQSRVHWSAEQRVNYYFDEPGYLDWREERLQVFSLIIRLSLVIVAAYRQVDTVLLRGIRENIAEWATKLDGAPGFTDGFSVESHLCSVLETAAESARKGILNRSVAVQELGRLEDAELQHEVLWSSCDLLEQYDAADPWELGMLDDIAVELDISTDSIGALLAARAPKRPDPQASPEDHLGLDPHWTNDQKKRHLRSEFMKWSSRMNALTDTPQRDHAQHMLDLIGKHYREYE